MSGRRQQARLRPSEVHKKFNELDWENVKIILIDSVKCETKEEQLREENRHIILHRLNKLCLNTNRSYLTEEERRNLKKVYYEMNKEHIKEYKKQYQQLNKTVLNDISRKYHDDNNERIKLYKEAWGSERMTCVCGCTVRKDYLNRHKTMKIHINWLKENSSETEQSYY